MVKGEDEKIEVKLMNNPATSNLTIAYKADQRINSSLKVFSMSGAEVYQTKLSAPAGTHHISVPVQHLQNGAYILVIDSVQGRKAIQFVKK